jgi:hypothetical protein
LERRLRQPVEAHESSVGDEPKPVSRRALEAGS